MLKKLCLVSAIVFATAVHTNVVSASEVVSTESSAVVASAVSEVIAVFDDGSRKTVRTKAQTVDGFVKEYSRGKDIELIYDVAPETPIEDLVLLRLKTKTVSFLEEKIDIAFITEFVEDSTVPEGIEVTQQEGVAGEMLITSETVTVSGEEVSRTVVAQELLAEPVSAIVRVGTGTGFTVTQDGYFKAVNVIEMTATAYCPCKGCIKKEPGQKGYRMTASGLEAKHGVVSVDTKVIPLGTKLYIEDYGFAIAGDTGGGVKGDKIDLFYEEYDVAHSFGKQQRTVYILEQ